MEDNEKMLLMELRNQHNILMEELGVFQNAYADCTQQKREILLTGTTPTQLFQFTQYISEVNKRIALKQDEIDKMLIRIEKQAQVLKEIRTEVKTLEKLKEKQLESYHGKLSKENELLIEEFVANKVS
jgi:flagellar export protein FliJ